ncbi:DNA methyltransferase [Novosphingobium sp.]|uniref:DNA methyltransferase n=1 Tax=Novosphingobium sp. TaxID=1874826 RepID=UPI0026313044|nr:DNA methyltransferase [Novosphingobium sp.]
MTNTLYYGDNLHVLREHVKDESVDLIYLDPPFNSNANYNILFKSPEGHNSDAQIEAFEDTWHWNDSAEAAFDEVMRSGNTAAFELLRAMRGFLGDNDMMAYLAMMAVRLLELHRVLKPTGSLYLHCDPTASHYLKLLLDGVFGVQFYRNEIVWKRTSAHGNVSVSYGDVTDTIFYYTKGSKPTWNRPMMPLSAKNVETKYNMVDDEGRRYTTRDMRNPGVRPNLQYNYTALNGVTYQPHPNGWTCTQDKMRAYDEAGKLHYPREPGGRLRLKLYLDETAGQPQQTLWDDIPPINSQAQERLGYPTQKPLALLERIIAASSNEGDVVLDPFCGCGTAVHAAQKLGRQWLGIDVTHLAISLIEKRMKDAFPGAAFTVEGRPQDLGAALDLAERDKYQFQWWAVSLVDALPFGGKKKGADGGIDGLIYFKPDGKRTEKALVSVKGGKNVDVKMIRDLHSAMEREKAPFGVFICAGLPTKPMEREAASVGQWQNEYTGRSHPRLQILTLAELFKGKRPDIPWVDASVMKSAKREDTGRQGNLL